MGERDNKEILNQATRDAKRSFCAIVCAWKEIIVWIIVWMVTIVTAWVIYELVIVESVFGSGAGGPLGAIGSFIVTIFVAIILLLVILGLSIMQDKIWTPLKRKWLECWRDNAPLDSDSSAYTE